ncbi:carbon-nitrogen hydrolase family protein [Psychrobacter frigidicola]|uniref:Carbon-nitrogen hydrolase family protein n=1 Tax=Psychrobacter frigidicola TaxID=45611 RepID=A0A5C7AA31_9GAMM|nr:carbon-nitrogen hydrolase family protein [Psychrobacter frigidicola]TXD97653.1 carbon-nitrogen hydrolase family protein [Psychrobacter frigidicola]
MKIIINQINIIDYQVLINSTLILKSINDHKACNDFMIFPELALTGFPTKDNIEYLWDESEEHFQNILLASKNTGSTIIIGHIEKQDQFFYNSCFFIKNGEVIHKHRKSKLWLDDIGIFTNGNDLSVIEIDNVVCGAQICFELEFPEGSRSLAKLGAEIIFMPNGNMSPYANVHYVLTQARAIENQCFVITCNSVGVGHGGKFVGESLVVSPTGEIIKKLDSMQEIVEVNIDLRDIKKSEKDYKYINLI